MTSWVEGTAHCPFVSIMQYSPFGELFQNYEMQVTNVICLENSFSKEIFFSKKRNKVDHFDVFPQNHGNLMECLIFVYVHIELCIHFDCYCFFFFI